MEKIHELLNITSNDQLNYLIFGVAVLIIAFVLLRALRLILNRFIKKASEDLKVDPTQYKFLKNALSFIIYLGAVSLIFLTIPPLKSLGLTLFAGAGIFAAIVGFASQAAFSNIVSGIFIIIFKPFRVGDIIKLTNTGLGSVEDITLRHTVIRDFENKRLIIPNSVISADSIHNYNIIDEKVYNFIPYGISYDSDIDLAIKIIQEEAIKHPNFVDNRTLEEKQQEVPPAIVRLINYGDSSINLRLQVWTDDPMKGLILKYDINKSIKHRFDNEGIEIPFPHRTLVYKDVRKDKD